VHHTRRVQGSRMQSLAAGLVPFSPSHSPFFAKLGFVRKLRAHIQGCVFRSTSNRRWKINRNSEKCGKMCIRLGAQGWPEGCRVPDLGDFIDLRLRTSDSYCIHSTLSVQVVFHHRRLCKNE